MGKHISFNGDVVVIGATGIDNISRPLHIMQAGASNPVRWQRFAGGVATNVAQGISRQLNAHLITAIGDDPEGQALVARLRDAGMAVAPFKASNSSTGNYTAVLDEKGELFVGLSDFRSIELLTWEQIAERLPALAQADSQKNDMRAVILDANLSQQCITDAVHGLQHANTRLFALTVSPAKAVRWLPVANKVHVLFCNRAEAATLTSLPISSPLDCLADGLTEAGFRQFVVSDGGSPALVQELQCPECDTAENLGAPHTSSQRHWVSASPLPDGAETLCTVNGAGDAMAAATIAHYLQQTTASLSESLSLGGMPAAVDILTGERGPMPIN